MVLKVSPDLMAIRAEFKDETITPIVDSRSRTSYTPPKARDGIKLMEAAMMLAKVVRMLTWILIPNWISSRIFKISQSERKKFW